MSSDTGCGRQSPWADCGPYKTLADVEYATAGWVDWWNHRRFQATLGMTTPHDYEQAHYAALAREPQPT